MEEDDDRGFGVDASPEAMEEEEEDRGQGGFPERPAVEDDDGFSFPVQPLDADRCIVPVYPIFGRPASGSPLAPVTEHEPETATLRVPLGRLLLEEREFRARQQQQQQQQHGRSLTISAPQSHHSQEEEDEDDDDEEEEASAAADEELAGVPPETYCLWTPSGGGQHQASAPASPAPRCRKSGSTGSVLRWRRISDRLVGRSHSDGKEKFIFLNAPALGLGLGVLHPPPPPGPPGSNKDEQQGAVSSTRGDGAGDVGWPLRYYGRGGAAGSGRRRSYLPYKQELVGLFANVSGLRRSYHPF